MRWENPICAPPRLSKFPQRCHCDSSSVRLIDNGPFSSFQGRSSSASSSHASILQANNGVMFLALCLQIVSQAPQHVSVINMCGKNIKSVTSQPFFDFHWQRANQYGCTPRKSNSKEESLFFCMTTDRTARWNLRVDVFARSVSAFCGQLAYSFRLPFNHYWAAEQTWLP